MDLMLKPIVFSLLLKYMNLFYQLFLVIYRDYCIWDAIHSYQGMQQFHPFLNCFCHLCQNIHCLKCGLLDLLIKNQNLINQLRSHSFELQYKKNEKKPTYQWIYKCLCYFHIFKTSLSFLQRMVHNTNTDCLRIFTLPSIHKQ
jgi:hypothetical protein